MASSLSCMAYLAAFLRCSVGGYCTCVCDYVIGENKLMMMIIMFTAYCVNVVLNLVRTKLQCLYRCRTCCK